MTINPKSQRCAWFAVAAVLLPAGVGAQAPATSFDDLQRILKPGQTVIVTDVRGHETKGKVGELTASSLLVLTPEQRPFASGAISRVRRTDGVWNGLLIGAAIGGAVAVGGIMATQGESDNFYSWGYIGSWLLPSAGALSGALVDRAITATVYVAPEPSPNSTSGGVSVTHGGGTGVLVSLRF